jgi:thiol-disulfide isomerase/thioredoxin
MKSKIRLIIIVFAVSLFALLIYGIVSRISRINSIENSIQEFPYFTFNTLDGNNFNSSEIKSGPVLVVYFHPECEHCQYEINALLDNLQKMENSEIILISYAERDSIRVFLGNRLTEMNNNVIILVDESLKFKDYFGSDMIPGTFIYDKNLKLVRHFKGEVKAEAIIKFLQ